VNSEQLFRRDPREYALGLVSDGVISHEELCQALLCRMSSDDVRDALDANELSPRFLDDDDPECREIADYLESLGPTFAGDDSLAASYVASDWIANGFDLDGVREWSAVGFWDPGAARHCEDLGCTPEQIAAAAEVIDASAHAPSCGAINAACNGDLAPETLVVWASQ
jgi:hypothetical protein